MSADHMCFANRLCLQDVNPWHQPCFGFIIVQVYDTVMQLTIIVCRKRCNIHISRLIYTVFIFFQRCFMFQFKY